MRGVAAARDFSRRRRRHRARGVVTTVWNLATWSSHAAAMPMTRARRATSVDASDGEEEAKDVRESARVDRRAASDDEDDDDEAPEEVTRDASRAAAAARRDAERDASRALREAKKAREGKKREEAIARKDARAEAGGKKARAKDEEDELEELPEDVVDALARDGRRRRERDAGGESSASDDDNERDAYEAYESRGKKTKKSVKVKKSRYERDGFDVVALDAAEDEDDHGVVAPRSAMDFMRDRLINKYARSGEMLRDSKTGRIPNAFARR